LPADATVLDPAREDVRTSSSACITSMASTATRCGAILALARIQPPIIEAISRPAERVRPWHEYRKIFMTEERIAAGVLFWQAHREGIERVAAETGVPGEILVGIIGVETFYGRIIGRYRVLDALATLAFEYPPRSAFFARELEQFLLLVREQGLEIETPVGSYAGAMGLPQFIPSSYRAYAVDGDGDGRIDLWTSIDDILASVANYFRAHGWRRRAGRRAGCCRGRPDPASLVDQGLVPTSRRGHAVGRRDRPGGPGAAGPGRGRRAVRARARGRAALLGGVPQFLRDHALQPQPHVCARGPPARRGDRNADREARMRAEPGSSRAWRCMLAAARWLVAGCARARAGRRRRHRRRPGAPARRDGFRTRCRAPSRAAARGNPPFTR
jgi:membrane-bound lytic murein transglycosylase B